MNLEIANPMEMILPNNGAFFNAGSNGFKNLPILASIPPPLKIFPILLKGFEATDLKPLRKSSLKFLTISPKKSAILPPLKILPKFVILPKIFEIIFVKPPRILKPIFDKIFKIPLKGPSVINPVKRVPIVPKSNHHMDCSFFSSTKFLTFSILEEGVLEEGVIL